MTSYSNCRLARVIFLFLLSPLISLSILAQIPDSMTEATNARWGGNNFIVGTIFLPSGRPANSRIVLRLSSMIKGDILITADDSGRFIIGGISEGTYTVIIDSEKEYQRVAQDVEVIRSRNPSPVTYTMSIRLVEKPYSGPKPGVVNAEIASAPKRALAFYDKALELSKV